MANQEIDDFTEDTTPADGDLLVSVDISDTTDSPQGTTKKVQAQNLVVKKLRTSTGPAVLTVGAVADGEFLKRSGTSIISAASGGGGGTFEDFDEGAAPATPAAAKVRLYAKADGLLYSKDDAGLETVVTGGGGGGTPGGSDTEVQFNDGGAFGGDAGLMYNKTTDILTVGAAGKVRTGTGLAATPSFSFTSFTDSGMYNDGGGAVIMASAGADVAGFNATSLIVKTGKGLGFGSALGSTGMNAGFRSPAQGQMAIVNQDSDTTAATLYGPTRTMAVPGGNPTPNMREGNVQRHTMTGNITVGAPTNMQDGIEFTLIFIQDATGSRTGAWNAVYKWVGGTAPTLTTAANSVDIFRFWTNGTNAYELSRALDVK